MTYDAIVAGAGIWGCTLARRLAEAGRQVLVLEKRPSVGGNVRCETDPETGIEIHTYGSHIFHTHLPEVWAFVNRFAAFNGYQHKVLARTKARWNDGRAPAEPPAYRTFHLPLGLTLLNKFFGTELAPGDVEAFMKDEAHARAIFDAFFRGYTSKQWGRPPEELDPSVIRRVPVRSNYDTNYFNDYRQGIPSAGYNALFDRLLDHPRIAVETEMTFGCENGALRARRNATSRQAPLEIACGGAGRAAAPVYYSGPVDALFGHAFGALPWRTLRFERETLPLADFQGTSVVNYPDADVPYTRIHEFKHYHPEGRWNDPAADWGFHSPKTVVMREYPGAWQPGDEPYYPIDSDDSRNLLARYRERVDAFNRENLRSDGTPLLTVGGRLGGYKYYDIDRSIEAALNVAL